MPASSRLRDLVGALSLANLVFLRLWMKLLPYAPGGGYYLACSPRNSYLAALLNVALWGCACFLLLRLARRNGRAFPWLVLALLALVGVTALYGVALSYTSSAKLVFLLGASNFLFLEVGCCLAGAALAALLVKHRVRLARLFPALPLLFSPFLVVTCGQSLAALARTEPAARFRPHRVDPAGPLRNPLGMSVVWMIFDETDYRLCFDQRPAGYSFPAFDRVRAQSLWASRAYSPSDATQVSLPALLTGIPLQSAVPVGARRLDLLPAGSRDRLDFAGQQNVFDRVKLRGGSTALFGWYHPYARVMHGVDLCRDYPRYNFFTSDSLLRVLLFQWVEVLDLRFLPFSNTVLGNNQIGIVRDMQSDVLSAVKSQDPSFMFLHYSVPHSPNIYRRDSGSFGLNRSSRDGYLNNMALADRCLAELRAEMERKGSWENALVIISSDHHWRTNTYDGVTDFEHVPFMVKFPHQAKEVSYDSRFNTVLTQDLILAVLDGGVQTPESARDWLNRSLKRAPNGKVIFSINQPDAD